MGPGGVNDVMYRKRARRIWGIWEKSVSWVLASEEDGWLSELTEALRRVPRVVGDRWKSQHRKIVYLSPYVEKPFNSKVIKSFVPELRSKVFRVSGFLCFLYMIYEHSMYVSHIRIHEWLCYTPSSGLNNIIAFFSARIALALNNPRKLICLWTKKPS